MKNFFFRRLVRRLFFCYVPLPFRARNGAGAPLGNAGAVPWEAPFWLAGFFATVTGKSCNWIFRVELSIVSCVSDFVTRYKVLWPSTRLFQTWLFISLSYFRDDMVLKQSSCFVLHLLIISEWAKKRFVDHVSCVWTVVSWYISSKGTSDQ